MVFSKAMLVWIENVRVFCKCHQLASENVLKDFAGHAGQADGSVDSCDILFTFWNECLYRLSLFSWWVEPHLLHFLYILLFILINLSIHGRESLHFVRHLRMKVSMALVISCFFFCSREHQVKDYILVWCKPCVDSNTESYLTSQPYCASKPFSSVACRSSDVQPVP